MAALWAALAALVACCAARPELHSRTPFEATAFLQERTRKSSSALRGVAGAVEDIAPEEVAALKQQIANLQAEKKGLTLAVRRLLKANRTEAEKSMVNALRGAKLQEQTTEKKLADTEMADKMHIAKLLKIQKQNFQMLKIQKATAEELKQKAASSEKLTQMALEKSTADAKKQASTIATLQAQVAQEEAALATLRQKLGSSANKEDGASQKEEKEEEAEVLQLKQQNSKLQEEKRGLEGTVQKLWKVNAPEGAKSMLKVLGQEEERLKVVNRARQAEEMQFAKEKSELSNKVSEVERRYEMDVEVMKTLQGDNQRLRTLLQNQSSLEVGAKVAMGLGERSKELESELAKLKLKEADELQTSQSSQIKLQASLEKDEADLVKLQKANQQLEMASQEQKKAFDKLQAAKDSDENIFAQQLSTIQKEVSNGKEMLHQKDEELKEVSSRGMKFYWNEWQHAQALLLNNITSQDKAKMLLEAKVVDLSREVSKKDEEAALLRNETGLLHKELEGLEAKLTYAVDQENLGLLHMDKLKADSEFLAEALRKEKELEPQLAKVQAHDEALRKENLKLASNVLHEREQVKEMQQNSGTAVQKVAQERTKLDFAVDQENTEMLAVKVLQGQNKKLKESLQQNTDLEVELQHLKDDEVAKVATIKELEAERVASTANVTGLMEQMATLEHTKGELEDQYTQERSKLVSMAEQDSTDALALKVIQGEYQKLQEELQETQEDEAKMEQLEKSKAAASDTAAAEEGRMRRELAGVHQKEEALQHKNGELQETIATMAAKNFDDQMSVQKAFAAPKPSPRPVPPSDGGLEKASMELSKLEAQLGKAGEAGARVEAADS